MSKRAKAVKVGDDRILEVVACSSYCVCCSRWCRLTSQGNRLLSERLYFAKKEGDRNKNNSFRHQVKRRHVSSKNTVHFYRFGPFLFS